MTSSFSLVRKLTSIGRASRSGAVRSIPAAAAVCEISTVCPAESSRAAHPPINSATRRTTARVPLTVTAA